MKSTPEECTAARIAAGALRRELKKLDTWMKAGAVSPAQRAAVVALLQELEKRAGALLVANDESAPLRQRPLGFEKPEGGT